MGKGPTSVEINSKLMRIVLVAAIVIETAAKFAKLEFGFWWKKERNSADTHKQREAPGVALRCAPSLNVKSTSFTTLLTSLSFRLRQSGVVRKSAGTHAQYPYTV
ncbi:hypothetical protein KPH14_011166 [Odynerus spinipes]|uniref:Uncharacterized protein n=1 Tax=Odynerus spinipes TaxID=1348599 RepID=A0AAD9RGP9_9HYME|nr:hypothetical protein KPH14_011166 [Odynerus spinipes]